MSVALFKNNDAIAGSVIRTYTYGPGVDDIQSMTVYDEYGGSETYYYVKDASNTVHVLVDETGLIVEYYYYDAFGNVKMRDENYQWMTESKYGNRFLFQGREYDYDTALYYFRARWYEPETGRWLSPDPIGISGGLNLYAFCGNDPVNYIDPEGNIHFLISAGIGALVNGAIDVIAQVSTGAGFSDINWGSVAKSAAVGAITGLAGGIKILEKGFNVGKELSLTRAFATGCTMSVVGAASNMAEQVSNNVEKDEVWYNGFGEAAAWGAMGGFVGGALPIPLKTKKFSYMGGGTPGIDYAYPWFGYAPNWKIPMKPVDVLPISKNKADCVSIIIGGVISNGQKIR